MPGAGGGLDKIAAAWFVETAPAPTRPASFYLTPPLPHPNAANRVHQAVTAARSEVATVDKLLAEQAAAHAQREHEREAERAEAEMAGLDAGEDGVKSDEKSEEQFAKTKLERRKRDAHMSLRSLLQALDANTQVLAYMVRQSIQTNVLT